MIRQQLMAYKPGHDTMENLKVKMFILKEPTEAEEVIDAWLSGNRVQVKHIAQSQGEKNGRFLFILSLFYVPEA